MTGFDQLGLFSSDGVGKNSVQSPSSTCKLSLGIEFSQMVNEKKIEAMVKKITKDIELLDQKAVIRSQLEGDDRSWVELPFFAIDVETTGLDAVSNRIIELALVPFNMSDDVKPFSQLYSVGEALSHEIVNITGISDEMLKNQPAFKETADDCIRMMKRVPFVVAYNAKFDRPFLESEMARLGKVLPDVPWIDPFVFICELDRFKRGKKLSDAANRWGVNLEGAHRAAADAQAAGKLLLKMASAIGCHSLSELLFKQKVWQWQNAHNMAELKRASLWSTNR